jgi:uncharacterized membrane protein YfcA
MMIATPLELALLAAAIVAAGLLTGLLAGLFGVGGGAVVVPVLFEVFRLEGVDDAVRMQLCVGTSLAIIVPTTVRSYRAHRAKGLVLEGVMRAWALPAVMGVAVGAGIAAYAPAGVLKAAFAVIAAGVAARLLTTARSVTLGAALPGAAMMRIYGFLIGLAGSLIGVSGGSLATIVMTLYGTPIHRAVATSAGLGVPIAVAGTLGYVLAGLPHRSLLPPLAIGFVSIIGVLLIAPLSSLVAPIGARLAHRLPRRWLEIAFGLFLLAAALRFLISVIA